MPRQLVWKQKPNSGVLSYSSAPEGKLFNAVFGNDDAHKRVSFNGGYKYKPSKEYIQYYSRMKLNRPVRF
jgi:hypothetical protein